MPLTMRPTGLGSDFYKDKIDYGIHCGEWCMGRIYETRTVLADLRWFWALDPPSKPGHMQTSNHVASLDEAKASSRQAGSSGRPGRRWKRHRDGDDLETRVRRHHPADRTKPPASGDARQTWVSWACYGGASRGGDLMLG